MSKVIVTANESGLVITPSAKNPAFGYARVEQTKVSVVNGWARKSTRSALIQGEIEILEAMGLFNGQQREGNIFIVESTEPFNAEEPEKDLKVAGDTKVVCKIGGAPIYRKAFYDETGLAQDSLVSHDNIEEISAARVTADAKAKLAK
jgi:hypothetical protein